MKTKQPVWLNLSPLLSMDNRYVSMQWCPRIIQQIHRIYSMELNNNETTLCLNTSTYCVEVSGSLRLLEKFIDVITSFKIQYNRNMEYNVMHNDTIYLHFKLQSTLSISLLYCWLNAKIVSTCKIISITILGRSSNIQNPYPSGRHNTMNVPVCMKCYICSICKPYIVHALYC